jgi:uncharacterized membrane protein
MTLGPIDFLAVEFPGNKFKGEILSSLFELVEKEIIRIYDLVVVMKDEAGEVVVRELQELDSENVRILDPLHAESSQMLTHDDINAIAENLAPNSSAGLLLVENLWAKKLKQAMLDADANVLLFERIPHADVEQALADMAELQAQSA